MIHYAHPREEVDRKRQGFAAIDIPLPSSRMNASEITLTERYPEIGFSLNEESEMFVRVVSGAVVFQCGDDSVFLPSGSTVLVERNTRYFWSPQEHVTLYVVSSPPWTPEQHRNV